MTDTASIPSVACKPQRIVAIVGRPNVGKSALFNRLTGRRAAIVHAEEGVTRDRLITEAVWNTTPFLLMDTGGIVVHDRARTRHVIDTGIQDQIAAALADAAMVILVADIQAGLSPMDIEAARLLRAQGCTVLVAVNKADGPEHDAKADEFTRLGFPVFPVSATHNRGLDPLMQRVIQLVEPIPYAAPPPPLKVAVVGRPNVGKSSFVNALLGQSRVIVSEIPGTTRDSIDVPFSTGEGTEQRHYMLMDTAGMRQKTKMDSAVETFGRMRAEQSIERSDATLLMLDAVQGPTAYDKKIAALIMEKNKACAILVNKWDLAKGIKPNDYQTALHKTLMFLKHCPVLFVSSKNGTHVQQALPVLETISRNTNTAFPTGLLNRVLAKAFEKVNPPSRNGQRLRLFYATQTGVMPLRIRLFVNNPKLAVPAYHEYLIRVMRENFNLQGVPVVLQYRARSRKPEA